MPLAQSRLVRFVSRAQPKICVPTGAGNARGCIRGRCLRVAREAESGYRSHAATERGDHDRHRVPRPREKHALPDVVESSNTGTAAYEVPWRDLPQIAFRVEKLKTDLDCAEVLLGLLCGGYFEVVLVLKVRSCFLLRSIPYRDVGSQWNAVEDRLQTAAQRCFSTEK